MADTITTHEAKTHLSRFLAEVEKGKSFTIARGKTPVAVLSPVDHKKKHRPKVGEILGEKIEPVPDDALTALSKEELEKEWGI